MIRIARAGLLTTVQDLGRPGVQRHGIVTAGAMDAVAHSIVNLLVGNFVSAATLEATMIGPTIEFESDALVAIGGADLNGTLDDQPVPLWCPFFAPAGSVLALAGARSGCRAYIAIAGGIDVPLIFGSRATDLIARMGGLEGRPLLTGDALDTGAPGDTSVRILDRIAAGPRAARSAGRSLLPRYAQAMTVRVMRGPEFDRFGANSRAMLLKEAFHVTPQSNRMGLRLKGPALSLAGPYDLYSSPVAAGSVQVPPSGEPIVLMSDHQTIGGYPRIAMVATVDLPLLAQAPPGARVQFHEIGVGEAQALYLSRQRDLRMFAEALRIHYA